MLNCLIADASRLNICAEVNVSPRAKLKVPRPPGVIIIEIHIQRELHSVKPPEGPYRAD